MRSNHTGHHQGASSAQRDSRNQTRQSEYLQKLRRLSPRESRLYKQLYDAIADAKGVTTSVLEMMTQTHNNPKVQTLAQEMITLVESLRASLRQNDPDTTHSLQANLDDINIAVNAWTNGICLGRSAFLYTRYRHLRKMARHYSPN